MLSVGQKVETINGVGIIEDIKVQGSELAYVIRHSKRADIMATRDIYGADEIEPIRCSRVSRHDFFFLSDLTDTRKDAIIEWINTLPEDNYNMLREFLYEQEMEKDFNENDD